VKIEIVCGEEVIDQILSILASKAKPGNPEMRITFSLLKKFLTPVFNSINTASAIMCQGMAIKNDSR
jgi:hypothetical protein